MTKKHTKTVAQAATLLALLAAAGLASADQNGMRTYRALALDGAGERIAAIESVDGEPKAGPRVVVRERAGGKIAATY
jgi:hypothetical protein